MSFAGQAAISRGPDRCREFYLVEICGLYWKLDLNALFLRCTVGSSMPLKTYRPSRLPTTEPLVTVAPGVFRISAVAAKSAGLESAHWVRFSTDERERLIGFEFLSGAIRPEGRPQAGETQG